MRPICRLQLLGGLCLDVCGHPATRFRTRKTAELLAYLAYHLRREHPRELLADLLWPELEPEAGRHSLSMALSSLRQQLEPAGLVSEGCAMVADRHSVRLNPDVVTTDVRQFEEALQAAARAGEPAETTSLLATAVDLYAGELLPGFYNEWVFPEQQRLQELFFKALRELIVRLEEDGRHDLALQHALRALREDPVREDVHRDVIRLYVAAGRPESAARQYAELERRLRDQLDSEPSEETQALMRVRPAPRPATSPVPSAHGNGALPAAGRVPPDAPEPEWLEPVGGAVPLHSRFYVIRPTDEELKSAIARGDSVVLVKGARQVGKTSLLARGLQQARQAGVRVALTHFQVLNAAQLDSAGSLMMALAETLCEQLDLETHPADMWDPRRGPSLNLRRYVRRHVLGESSTRLVWGLDEVDRIFTSPWGTDLFGLFRSWHDERALDPEGPWSRLTLTIAYSTEAHLFIADLNQSPFNVGTRISLQDFTLQQVADLNQRYGTPLRDAAAVARYHDLVGGHPFLVRRGLHEMAVRGVELAEFERLAPAEHWVYGDHLRRIELLVERDAELSQAVREVLAGRPCPGRSSFHRLRSAGVLIGEAAAEAQFRCRLYALYLGQQRT